MIVILTLISLALTGANGFKPYHDPHFQSSRIGIVQMFEWTFGAIADECENFLGPKKFAGVQLSPVNEYAVLENRPWYERYQPISYKIMTRSGNEKQFADMVRRCNNAGIRTYIDIIPNHMAMDGPTDIIYGTAGSESVPKDRQFPGVPYTKDDFNPECIIIDYWNKTQARDCDLFGLHDLDQSKPHVREEILKFLNKLVRLGVAGFRVDAASHMWPEDLSYIYDNIDDLNTDFNFKPNSRPFIYQEATMYKEDYVHLGRVVEFKYSYFVTNGIRGIYPLQNYYNLGETWDLVASEDALVFIDNHDTQRTSETLTYKEPRLYVTATAFMLAYPFGVVRIMSSFAFESNEDGPPKDQFENILDPLPRKGAVDRRPPPPPPQDNRKCLNGWNCEHRMPGIAEMIQFASIVDGTPLKEFWGNSDNQIAFCRGNVGFVAFNVGSKEMNQELRTCLPAGRYCDTASGKVTDGKRCSGRTIVVNRDGRASIKISNADRFQFIAIHLNSRLN